MKAYENAWQGQLQRVDRSFLMVFGVVVRIIIRGQIYLSDGVSLPVIDDKVKVATAALVLPSNAQPIGAAL
jgi:hypothetical protein